MALQSPSVRKLIILTVNLKRKIKDAGVHLKTSLIRSEF